MAINNWLSKHAVGASKLGAYEAERYAYHFLDAALLEDALFSELCENCSYRCTAPSPLSPLCVYCDEALNFVHCCIACDMAIRNWPFHRLFTEGGENHD